MRRWIKIVSTFGAFTLIFLFLSQPVDQAKTENSNRSPGFGLSSGNEKNQQSGTVQNSDPVQPTISPAVRDLPPIELEDDYFLDREVSPRFTFKPVADPDRRIEGGPDPLLPLQLSSKATTAVPILNHNFDGFTTGTIVHDPTGDVGLNYYIQATNSGGGSSISIFDKVTGASVSVFTLDSLGTAQCANGFGDPIVLYDEMASRWFLSEFSNSGNRLCIYISQTGDPTGSYFAYNFQAVNSFPDYPKYGVWPDAYYAGTNESSSTAYAFDRAAMLAGTAAASQSFNITDLSGFNFQMVPPADIDGQTLPPGGAPAIYMRHRDTEVHGAGSCPNAGSSDCLELFEFHVDWVTPANSTFTQVASLEVAEFDSDLCGLTSFFCFPQKDSTTTLDPLREVIMWRLQYRNFGTHETLAASQVTDVDGTDHGGVRWYELRKSGGGSWSLFQQGTFAPDAKHRWMPSIAMDISGNIALAYAISDSTIHPSIRMTGREAGDALGTMSNAEVTIHDGTGTTNSNRWGDYSSLNVDPVDGCTFWYTMEYGAGNSRNTRIASFKFDSCGGSSTPDFSMDTTPASQEICVGSDALFTVSTAALAGFSGDVTLTAIGQPGTAAFSPNPVTPTGDSTLTISGAAAGIYNFDVLGTSVLTPSLIHSNTLSLNVVTLPLIPTLTSPTDGVSNVSTTPTYNWTTAAGASSYLIEIATDVGFSNIVDSATVTTTNHTGAALNNNVTYFWRMKAANVCGMGGYSSIFSFTTEVAPPVPTEICQTPNLAIPDNNPSGVDDVLSVAASGNILDLNVMITATHTWVGDLKFTLTHDDTSTAIDLIDRPGVPASTNGCSSNNITAILDDSAVNPVENECSGTPAINGIFSPNEALNAFNSENINGNWTLTVSDNAGIDTGTLDGWCLLPTVCAIPATVTDVVATMVTTTTLALDWSAVAADSYEVWWGIDAPYFTPGADCAAAANCTMVVTNHFEAPNLGDANQNYSYVVKAANSCGTVAGNSNRTAEFDFVLVPGS